MKAENITFAEVLLPCVRGFPALAGQPWEMNGACGLHLNMLTANVQHGGGAKRVVAEGRQHQMMRDLFFQEYGVFSEFPKYCLPHTSSARHLSRLASSPLSCWALGAGGRVLPPVWEERGSRPVPVAGDRCCTMTVLGSGPRCAMPRPRLHLASSMVPVPWLPRRGKEILKSTLQISEASSINKRARRLARWKKCKVPW